MKKSNNTEITTLKICFVNSNIIELNISETLAKKFFEAISTTNEEIFNIDNKILINRKELLYAIKK